MKQLKHKKTLGLIALGLGVVLLSSCTANFCSPADQSAMAYPYEQGATVYVSKAEYETLKSDEATKKIIEAEEALSVEAAAYGLPAIAGPAFGSSAVNDNVYKYIPYEGTGDSLTLTANKVAGFLGDFLSNAKTAGYSVPGIYYYALLDDYVLKAATLEYFKNTGTTTYVYNVPTKVEDDPFNATFTTEYASQLSSILAGSEESAQGSSFVAVNPYKESDPKEKPTEIPMANSILRARGTVKFTGANSQFLGNMAGWNELIRSQANKGFARLTTYDVPGIDYEAYYGTQITAKISTYRSCIATRDGEFGHYGTFADWRVSITQKDWGYAWSKGFFEGLLVYPVTWLLDTLAYSFDANLTGMGQIWALVIVTLIVRGILLAVSFRSTMDNQKMQALQPEITKLQQKYPNAQTNQAEKQRLSQETMMLYRRHGIKPFRQMLIMIVQFPVFICVWAGLQGSAALSTGEILGMRLSDNINTILFNVNGWYMNDHGWWTALVLFLLMAATQVFAMLLPRIIAKKRAKGVAKTVKAQENNTMKWVSYGLIIFTIIMGFFLPSAMGVYWLIGGLISVAQTLITQSIMAKSKKGK